MRSKYSVKTFFCDDLLFNNDICKQICSQLSAIDMEHDTSSELLQNSTAPINIAITNYPGNNYVTERKEVLPPIN